MSYRLRIAAIIALGVLAMIGCDNAAPPTPDAGGGLDASDLDGRVPDPDSGAECTADPDCDDGLFCNGPEQCGAGTCSDGTPPCAAADCDESADSCDTTCADADGDGDGVDSIACGGTDCDDTDAQRFPGNTEICDAADRDEDCDPTTYGYRDLDMDGAPDASCCNDDGAGGTTCGDDCNDMRAGVNPTVPEVCDGLDNDCDGSADEGVQTTYYVDADHDSFGVDDAATNMQACFAPTGYSDTAGDCNDAVAAVHPGAVDVCDAAGVDDDCDTMPNNPPGGCSCTGTESRDCSLPGLCSSGTEMCSGGSWGACSIAPVTETCNSLDDDCDGATDNGVTVTCYTDSDNDSYSGTGAATTVTCPVGGRTMFGGCPTGFTDRAPVAPMLDCDDARRESSPAGTEVCNTLDDDCDGVVDELLTLTCYSDSDGDGYAPVGAPAQQLCPDPSRTTVGGCPVGTTNRAPATGAIDCVDTDSSRSPGTTEICNAYDDDCDGMTNEGTTITCYADLDSDGYPAAGASPLASCPDSTRAAFGGCPVGQTATAPTGPATIDCDDLTGSRSPAATEVCNTVDDDCDGMTNEGTTISCWIDGDSDSFALASATAVQLCGDGAGGCGSGYTSRNPAGAGNSDCNDGNNTIRPGGTEICNMIDDNCDGTADEGVRTPFYRDGDSDGYGAAANVVYECTLPSGYVRDNTDCDDAANEVYPGHAEVCNDRDDDCDAMADELLATHTVYRDLDGDGHGAAASGTASLCGEIRGYVDENDDCADTGTGAASIYPGAPEQCTNGVDDNCNGAIDELALLWYVDADGDGYGSGTGQGPQCMPPSPTGWATLSGDCDDTRNYVRPGAPELCDGLDTDCTATAGAGEVDNAFGLNHPNEDNDGDGHGDATCTSPPPGAVLDDCLDTDAAAYGGPAAAPEIIGNNVDNDCNGAEVCFVDADSDGFRPVPTTSCSSDVTCGALGSSWRCVEGFCRNGIVSSGDVFCTGAGEGEATEPDTDCLDSNASVSPADPELADNGLDDDCDGSWGCFADADSDGHRPVTGGTVVYDTSPNNSCAEAGEGAAAEPANDCNDSSATVSPSDPELADNGVDDDCDGSHGCYYDSDDDGYSRSDGAIRDDSSDPGCGGPGEGASIEPRTDCDDANPDVSPGDPELPDNGISDDCDAYHGCYYDADNDGYSRSDAAVRDDSTDSDCLDSGEGSTAEPRTDCNDTNAAVSPGDPEVADNGISDDCDIYYGCYYDSDDDGYSRLDAAVRDDSVDNDCLDSGEGSSAEPRTDCSDYNAAVSPGDPEIPDNGISDDCDAYHGCYYDADNDGYSRSDGAVRDDSVDADCLDSGEGSTSEPRTDCCDNATYGANVRPNQTSYFSVARNAVCGGGFDYNCSGTEQRRYTALSSGSCAGTGTCPSITPGWNVTIPACGVTGTYITGCTGTYDPELRVIICEEAWDDTWVQTCR